jgi:hypothetical protein
MGTLVLANGRRPGWCYLGDPRAVNTAPARLGRYSSLELGSIKVCLRPSAPSHCNLGERRQSGMMSSGRPRVEGFLSDPSADDRRGVGSDGRAPTIAVQPCSRSSSGG